MVKKMLVMLLVILGSLVAERPASAGCTTALADCYLAAARIDSFWYRWAAGLDCELDYTDCVRTKLVGR
jgi:hypothetical protein